MKHIDFQVAWDGPVISHETNLKMAIDDLYVCEECMLAAASLLGFVKDKDGSLNDRLEETLNTVGKNAARIRYLEKELKDARKELEAIQLRETIILAAEDQLAQLRESVKV